MSGNLYDAIAEKILFDLESTFRKYPNIDEFYIIPTAEEDNKNKSPIIKGENTLGLESWIVSHIYPFAHHQILQKSNYKSQNLSKVIPCLTGVALLNPDMPTVWSRRRELILSRNLQPDNELRLAKMALSRKPKCNDALTHRRWIITEVMKHDHDQSELFSEELKLSEMIANRYHSNYHAWSHRMWTLQHLLPDSPFHVRKKNQRNCFLESVTVDLSELLTRPINRSEYVYIKTSNISRIFFEELENNFRWISSHVSDHSGLHHRKFVILEIFTFVKNCLDSNKIVEYDALNSSNLVSSVFSCGQINISEYFGSFEFDNEYKRDVENYLLNLEQQLTFFDLCMFLIVTELKSNSSLCSIFMNHEALWCYRRFLVFIYKQLIDALDYGKENGRKFLHLDRNGVPFKKDFKFDCSGESEQTPRFSRLYAAFYLRLLRNEEEILSKINSKDAHVNSLIKNYSQWLKQCFNSSLSLFKN